MLLLAPIVIEDQIIRWLVSLRENVSYVTRRTYMAAILTFYEINDITLRKRRIARFLGEKLFAATETGLILLKRYARC